MRLGQLDLAQAFLDRIGGPCVVRPMDTTAGAAVTSGVTSRAQLVRAMVRAAGRAHQLVVESRGEGAVYHLLFLDGVLLDVLERLPPRVTGDGRSTIGRLIEAENRRRIDGHGSAGLGLIEVDLDCLFTLERNGRTLRTVLAAGEVAPVKTATDQNGPTDNRSVIGEVSAALVDEARRAAILVGLRLVGVDVITTDPTRSLADSGGVIVDVDGRPRLHDHVLIVDPTMARPVAVPILRALLAPQPDPGGDDVAVGRALQPG